MNKLKKILLLLLVCTTLTACGEKNVEGELSELMESVYADVYADVPEEERPMLGNINVLEEVPDNIEYYIGTKDIKWKEAIASESGIGSIGHKKTRANRVKPSRAVKSAQARAAPA